jgi:hypothetical protein
LFSRENITKALKFWELARLPYNFVLAAIALTILAFARVDVQTALGMIMPVFLLAVIANVLYCAVYPIDLLVRASDFREPWRIARWGLWLVGTAFAGVLTFYTLGGPYIFGSGHG